MAARTINYGATTPRSTNRSQIGRWDRLRTETPGVYESYADIVAGEWDAPAHRGPGEERIVISLAKPRSRASSFTT